MSSSATTQRPMSKLKRRIQAGATAPLECLASNPSLAMANPDGSAPMDIEESNQDNLESVDSSLIKNFSFPTAPPNLCALSSKFAEALPSARTCSNRDLIFSLSPDIFSQPCRPDAFHGPSPDDEILIARRGTSLGASARRS